MLCASKRRSCLPLFQGLITLATPEKHPFSTKDVFQDKKISLTVKASYTSQTVFPAALTIALHFGLIHLVLAKWGFDVKKREVAVTDTMGHKNKKRVSAHIVS